MTCIVRSEMAGLSCIPRFRYPKVSRSHIMQAASLVLDIKDSHSSYYHFIRLFSKYNTVSIPTLNSL